MGDRNYNRRESIRKNITCSCGSNAKLSQRKNYPFGRKSGVRITRCYKCHSCNKTYPLNKPQEVRR